jgi:heme exporter protein B
VDRQAIKAIILKEWHLDRSNQAALGSTLLQVVTSVFILFLSVKVFSLPIWNALLFVVILFNLGQGLSRLFLNETTGKSFFLHSLASPSTIYLAKLIYNSALATVFTALTVFIYFLLIGSQASNPGYHALVLWLFSLNMSALFSFSASISGKTKNGAVLSIILALPLSIPIVLVSIRAGKRALDGILNTGFYQDILLLSVLWLLISTLGVALYHSVWRD